MVHGLMVMAVWCVGTGIHPRACTIVQLGGRGLSQKTYQLQINDVKIGTGPFVTYVSRCGFMGLRTVPKLQLKPRKGVTLLTGFFAIIWGHFQRYSPQYYVHLRTLAADKTP